MKKQELIEKLKSAGTVASNVFINVSEVITMIEEIDEVESSTISDNVISDIVHEIVSELDRNGRDVISDFEIDADVSGNNVEISISDVSFDSYEIETIVDNAVTKFINKNTEESNNQ
jgi:hypothetical protein